MANGSLISLLDDWWERNSRASDKENSVYCIKFIFFCIISVCGLLFL